MWQGCGRVQEEVFFSEINSKFSFPVSPPEMISLAMTSLAVRLCFLLDREGKGSCGWVGQVLHSGLHGSTWFRNERCAL
jgi:hypothetical protein